MRLGWQLAEVLAVTPETPRASRLVLRVPDWSGHRAGQHLVVRLTAPDGYTAQRSYSLASPPEEPDLALVVDRLPDGEVSPYLTQEVVPGDRVEVRGPIGGHFVWPDDPDGPVQLVAGGSGVVPFLAMLAHHRVTASPVPVRLLYSVRTEADVIGAAELARPDPGVRVTITLTREHPAGWAGARGRVGADLLAVHAVPAAEHPLVLACGPNAFVETVAQLLVDAGHDPVRIKTERFGATGP